ncbi:hypothetical protein Cgig2_023179 [Carnegiea gigantea]|uniref:YqaJ viral recombinase domain-containing protein n=1 Tax=Carnegiea gigantea TaxID=171969 RepID=A0A9Q1Q8V3_9CARY|nr:hypothetical protein Cgig2_023179 [Carnegiea gigantea]
MLPGDREEALVRYKLITGNKVLFPEFQVHGERYSEDDWLAASPDGVVENIVYDLPSRGVLEIKCPYFRGDPWKRIPLYCMPQAQGLMEILDKDWMDFYVWTPKGSSLFRVYRDPEYWDVLKIALSDFWWNHVQPARKLYSESVITDPLVQLKSLKPEPRHELCSYIVYESKHAVDNSKLLVREIDGSLQRTLGLIRLIFVKLVAPLLPEIMIYSTGFIVTIVMLANASDKTLLPWRSILPKMRKSLTPGRAVLSLDALAVRTGREELHGDSRHDFNQSLCS